MAGISQTVSKNIVAYREKNGKFRNRKELLKVSKLGPKAYEQCAGFLRIRNGDEPLDATAVHPESYTALAKLMEILMIDPRQLGEIKEFTTDVKALAEQTGIGVPTLEDILQELKRPGRDPREDMPAPVLRTDVLDMEDLAPGMVLKGTVRNAVDSKAANISS